MVGLGDLVNADGAPQKLAPRLRLISRFHIRQTIHHWMSAVSVRMAALPSYRERWELAFVQSERGLPGETHPPLIGAVLGDAHISVLDHADLK